MPLPDVVIDTNVLAHAGNPQEQRQADSVAFLKALLAGRARICVDLGFSLDEPKNRSKIGSEYLNHLSPGSVGFGIVQQLASSGRVAALKPTSDQGVTKKIRNLVSDKTDRVFLRVAVTSDGHTLVSHDFKHLPPAVRGVSRRRIGIDIRDAATTKALV